MNYHDTHFHLDLFENPQEMALKIEKEKIYTIAVTNSPSVFYFSKKISDESKYIRAAIGLHPELAASRENELTSLIELLGETRYVGEIGLDNMNKSVEDFRIQKKVFERIITKCAEKKDKILTVHSRRASSEVVSMIGNNFPGKVILHWYTGGIKDLERALDYGFYFSINFSMAQFNSGRKIIDRIPVDRILIESDGPFTKINGFPASPLTSKEILDKIISIKKLSDPSVNGEKVLQNFKELILVS